MECVILIQIKIITVLLDQLEKYYVDITCVQGMRWIGLGTIEKKNWIISYSCGSGRRKKTEEQAETKMGRQKMPGRWGREIGGMLQGIGTVGRSF